MSHSPTIVATAGPKLHKTTHFKKAYSSGARIIRFNFSHGDYDWFEKALQDAHKASSKTKDGLSILLDTSGPEVRTTTTNPTLELERSETYTMGSTKDADIQITHRKLYEICPKGTLIQVDSGKIQLRVEKQLHKKKQLLVKAMTGGIITQRRHVNVPGVDLALPILSKKDKEDIAFGIKHGIHLIAASFVSRASDIEKIRRFVRTYTDLAIPIIAKIESSMAVTHLEEIISVADGVMIARGDLALETSFEKIPAIQQRIINLAKTHRKPVILATQLLASMTENLVPTRAEVMDTSSVAYQHLNAGMLSEESSVGKHPFRAIKTMASILKQATKDRTLFESPMLCSPKEPLATFLGTTALLPKDLVITTVATIDELRNLALALHHHTPDATLVLSSEDETILAYARLLINVITTTSPLPTDGRFSSMRRFLKKADVNYQKRGLLVLTRSRSGRSITRFEAR